MLDTEAVLAQVARHEAYKNWVIVKAKDDSRVVL